MEGFFKYWGKARPAGESEAFHILPFHSLDVAAVGAALLERDDRLLRRLETISGFTAASLRRVLPYLLALHDLGKFSESFQDLKPELVTRLHGARAPRASPFRHDTLGYLLWRTWGSARCPAQERDLLGKLFPVALGTAELEQRDLDDLLQSWMAAVLGHHGRPPQEGSLGFNDFQAGGSSRRDAASFAFAVRKLLEPGALESTLHDVDVAIEAARRSSWWLAGFTILCDWLGSSDHFPYSSEERPLDDYWQRTRERAARAVSSSGLAAGTPRAYAGAAELFPGIADRLSPLQRAAATVDLGAGPQLFVLEDLTGSGKTEAALLLAHRLMAAGRSDGLFFALPTMATANAMDERVRPLVAKLFDGEASYLLSHSGPRLTPKEPLTELAGATDTPYGRSEESTASRAASSWLADNRKKALLADIGVGTIDQALLAVLQCRHAALRLFGAHRRVLVVDEVHACDAYMLGILRALLTAHAELGGSAILLSATLALGQRDELIRAFRAGLGTRGGRQAASLDYPLVTAVGAARLEERSVEAKPGSQRTLPVRWLGSLDEALAAVAAAVSSGRCVCWIRNSVADALEAYDAVASRAGRDRTTLFHARFSLGDRLEIEREVLRRFGLKGEPGLRSGRVVVATQVVEQSLDVDFDVMITDLCPVDLVVQRAGRLQRHPHRYPGRAAPELLVLAPAWSESPPKSWLEGPFRRTAKVYPDPGVLWRTARELRRRGALDLPGEARALIEAVYGDPTDVPAALEPRSSSAAGAEMGQAAIAQNAVFKLRLGYQRVGADWSEEAITPTRLGEPTTTVRLARVEGGELQPWCSNESPELRWPLSQVSVARRLVARAHPDDGEACRTVEERLPFVAPDTCTIPLRVSDDGQFTGRAVAERVRGGEVREVSVRVSYSPLRGLGIEEGS